jgi:hypothetical protein
MTAAPAEFRIDVSQEALDDLRLRLRRTRSSRISTPRSGGSAPLITVRVAVTQSREGNMPQCAGGRIPSVLSPLGLGGVSRRCCG